MARLQIIESEQNVRESRTPTTTALNLPLSLATQQGAAINSVVKAIGDIQNDLVKIETQNKVDKIKNIAIGRTYCSPPKPKINPAIKVELKNPSNNKCFFL